jgi:hypothetical protein
VTRVAVYYEPVDPENMAYRAVSRGGSAAGRTAGEALDALASQLTPEESETLVIERSMSPDRFFGAEERRRLEYLMALRREASAQSSSLGAEEHEELERLVDAEVKATAARAAALLHELGR